MTCTRVHTPDLSRAIDDSNPNAVCTLTRDRRGRPIYCDVTVKQRHISSHSAAGLLLCWFTCQIADELEKRASRCLKMVLRLGTSRERSGQVPRNTPASQARKNRPVPGLSTERRILPEKDDLRATNRKFIWHRPRDHGESRSAVRFAVTAQAKRSTEWLGTWRSILLCRTCRMVSFAIAAFDLGFRLLTRNQPESCGSGGAQATIASPKTGADSRMHMCVSTEVATPP